MLSLAGISGTNEHLNLVQKKENTKLNVIQCYAPTLDTDEETKEDFYNKLKTLCDKLKEKDMTILMGDLNAKIGSDNSG